MSLPVYHEGREESSREFNLEPDEDGEIDERAENIVLSLVGSHSFPSLDGSLSLNSTILQECICSIVFPPDILDQMETKGKISYESISHGENTILSSNSSGASLIPRPEASRDIFILSPHPQLNADEVNSLPTINTEYYSFERVFRDQRFDGRNHDDGESLSTASHSLMNVGVLSQNRQVLGSCEDVVVNRTSDHLINDLADGRRGIYWYDRLVSGSDWDQFRVVSKQFLKILSEESKTSPPCILPLPPISTARTISSSSRDLQDLVY